MPDDDELPEAEELTELEAVQTGFEPVVNEAPELPAVDNEGMEQALDDGATSEIERIRHQLRMLRQRAQAAGVVASPVGEAETEEPVSNETEVEPIEDALMPPLELPDTGLGDRLQALCEWSQLATRSDEVVLIGEFGDVIAGASSQISLVLSELMAWQSSLRDDPSLALGVTSSVERPMPDGRRITFVPVRSTYGGVTLAIVGAGKVTGPVAEELASGLLRALDPLA